MTMSRWERLAPLTGALAVVFWIVGAAILVSNDPGDHATPTEILNYFEHDENSVYIGSWIWGLGMLFFLWFLGSLRSRIASAEGGRARLASLAFGGGVGGAVLGLAIMAGDLGGVFAAEGKDNLAAEAAQALHNASQGFLPLASFPLLAMAAATAIAAFRHRALPKWLAWLTVVMAVLLAAYPIVWLSILFAFPVWTLIASVTLWRLGTEALEEPAPAATTPM